ncbi:type II toxin-antitoxin system MqsR family toxin [Hydrocarboniphaga sp.]|jgi:motility quorum-sensing regulator/GCU-specific mRNA interferase toxin|uniref:type II toxin-antitoxin system MqsR family toxin n=1 Tax=Hydrocarboniphaga sp. TaxID=2033016 RepID=UPI002ABC1BFE|nr:type II toxin-antitoxin system MqsR family toxin [Hydrocarboniphaga sp.]MDZ4078487.1 type II toxin-antitoxin system MqsR family toxin [Hydrocarboniphaga sp.]
MEKKVPHYKLVLVQAEVRQRGVDAFTRMALDGGRDMGLDFEQMVMAVCELSSKQFFKSMTTLADHTVWQDVYHAPTPAGVAYVKLTMRDGAVVIQFKRK